jgi:hypothetical protein
MKYQVTLWVSGRNYTDVVYANSPRDARDAAQARNPEAKIVSVNGTFK